MRTVKYLFKWLFSATASCPCPHDTWPMYVAIPFHVSNLIIGICYFSIVFIVARSWRYKNEGVSAWKFWSFASFVPAMGISRLVRVGQTWGPPYNITIILDMIACLCSLWSLINCRPLVRFILKLPSRSQLLVARDQAQTAYLHLEIQKKLDDIRTGKLEEELRKLTVVVGGHLWKLDRMAALDSISRVSQILREGKSVEDDEAGTANANINNNK